MHPTLVQWKDVGLHTWGLMITVAFAAAAMLTNARARRVGVDPDRLVPIYLLAPIFGLAGARLLHFLMAEPELFFSRPSAYFDMHEGGFAFYGGVILGVLGLTLYLAWRRMPLLKLADVIAPAVLLGDCLGRIGCFFAGCCHGMPVGKNAVSTLWTLQGGEVVRVDGFPWVALIYRRGIGVGDIFDVPIYPTQVWECLGTGILVILLSWMWKKARYFDGQIAAAAFLLYAPLRFAIESFRGDEVRGIGYMDRFSTSQMVSFGMVAVGLALLAWRVGKGVAPEEVVGEGEDELDGV